MQKLIFMILVTATTYSQARETNLNMLTAIEFDKLSHSEQNLYVKKVRQAVAEFETSFDKTATYAATSKMNFTLFDSAFADDGTYGDRCVIGGVVRSTYTNASGKHICPTGGRTCDPLGDKGYRCGKIFGESVCVDRDPAKDISNKCLEKADPASKITDYPKLKSIIEQYSKDICKEAKGEQETACKVLDTRFDQLAKENGKDKLDKTAKECPRDADHNKFAAQLFTAEKDVATKVTNCYLENNYEWNDDCTKIKSFSISARKNEKLTSASTAVPVKLSEDEGSQLTPDALATKIRAALDAKKVCQAETNPATAKAEKPNQKNCDQELEKMKNVLSAMKIENMMKKNNFNCNIQVQLNTDSSCKVISVTADEYAYESQIGEQEPPLKKFSLTKKDVDITDESQLIPAILNRTDDGFCTTKLPKTLDASNESGAPTLRTPPPTVRNSPPPPHTTGGGTFNLDSAPSVK